jgi:hypothetical protein
VYAVQGGNITVFNSSNAAQPVFSSSSVLINAAQSAPFVFLGTTTQLFSMQFTYSATAVLRAVTETRVVTGIATSISLLGTAYINDMAKLWILRSPVPGFQVELVFTVLSIQPNADFLTVYDGVHGSLSSLARWPLMPANITSGSECMTVLFTSDSSVSGGDGVLQGFAADFSFVRRVRQAGNISCTGACYAANVRFKW